MKVRYSVDARFPWPPGKEFSETVLDLEADDLPPNVAREMREHGLDFDSFYHWAAFGGEVWWWVRPL